jgi:hypothetical protein
MPKPTEKQLADADIVFEHSLYKPKLEPKYPFALVEVDDVPEPDAKGLRRVDGFKATWEATIEAGEYISRYPSLYRGKENIRRDRIRRETLTQEEVCRRTWLEDLERR